jgi:catechol 2,3-dioxygenase-like lactoylglutathione lyase family enzyme
MSQQTSREPSPNRGASVPDHKAIGEDRETIAEWQKKKNVDTSMQIRLVKVSHMRYQHPDLAEITTFMRDFGMRVVKRTDDKVWYGGYGSDQYVYYAQKGEKKYLGGTFLVDTYGDLEKAAKLPGAGQIERLLDAPGGGYILMLHDPEGFPVNLMFGQEEALAAEPPRPLTLNFESEKHRKRQFQRFSAGPAAVHKVSWRLESLFTWLTPWTAWTLRTGRAEFRRAGGVVHKNLQHCANRLLTCSQS